MSRPRQNPEVVRVQQFQVAVQHAQVDAGLVKKSELCEATGIPYATLWKRLHEPDGMTVAELRKLIAAVRIEPQAVLALLGYTPKEILRLLDHTA